jgi:hypothetical protein
LTQDFADGDLGSSKLQHAMCPWSVFINHPVGGILLSSDKTVAVIDGSGILADANVNGVAYVGHRQ